MKRTKRGVLGVIAVTALAAGVLALPSNAGAGIPRETAPVLEVDKALAPEDRVAATGPFTVVVTCEQEIENGPVSLDDHEPFVTTLVFNADGTPQSASRGGWVNDGDTWTYTGYELIESTCTVEETGKANATSVAYACWYDVEEVTVPLAVDEVEAVNGSESGCAEAGPSATPAVVVFGPVLCIADSEARCNRGVAKVTVTNTLPQAEAAPQQVIQPRFTG